MSSKNLYRIGGTAAFVSALLDFRDIFFIEPNDLGTRIDFYFYLLNIVLVILVYRALYHLFASVDRNFTLVAIISSVISAVALFINAAPFIDLPNGMLTTAWIFNHIIPVLLFGILAYRHYQLGMPKVLGVIGILYAVIQIIFYILYNVFSNLYLGIIDNLPPSLNLVWLIWTGIILLFGKLYESPDGVKRPYQNFQKEVVAGIGVLFLIFVGSSIYNKIHTSTTSAIATSAGYGVEFPFKLDPVKEWGERGKNVIVTCEDSIDQNFLDTDTARKLVAAGGKLDISTDGNTPSYLWIGNVPLELFVDPEDDGSSFGKNYYYEATVYCVTRLAGAKVDANGLGPNIYVITKVTLE